jgi:hypothetical protein
VRLLHGLAKACARFDDPNLVSRAGLVPVMALAQRAGLADLPAEHVRIGHRCGVNAHRRGQGADRDPLGAGRDQRPRPFPFGPLQPPHGKGDSRQDSPLPPARLDPLADRHPPIVPAAFRKLDALAVVTGPLLPAPLIAEVGDSTSRLGREERGSASPHR